MFLVPEILFKRIMKIDTRKAFREIKNSGIVDAQSLRPDLSTVTPRRRENIFILALENCYLISKQCLFLIRGTYGVTE